MAVVEPLLTQNSKVVIKRHFTLHDIEISGVGRLLELLAPAPLWLFGSCADDRRVLVWDMRDRKTPSKAQTEVAGERRPSHPPHVRHRAARAQRPTSPPARDRRSAFCKASGRFISVTIVETDPAGLTKLARVQCAGSDRVAEVSERARRLPPIGNGSRNRRNLTRCRAAVDRGLLQPPPTSFAAFEKHNPSAASSRRRSASGYRQPPIASSATLHTRRPLNI